MNGLDRCRNYRKPLEFGLTESRIRSARNWPAPEFDQLWAWSVPEFDQFGADQPQNSINLGLASPRIRSVLDLAGPRIRSVLDWPALKLDKFWNRPPPEFYHFLNDKPCKTLKSAPSTSMFKKSIFLFLNLPISNTMSKVYD